MYFSYHAVMGDRGFIKYMSLQSQISHLSQNYDTLNSERVSIEDNVIRLRPQTLDKDLLEERVRYVLGYSYNNEKMIVVN